jgi:hypothetical protein
MCTGRAILALKVRGVSCFGPKVRIMAKSVFALQCGKDEDVHGAGNIGSEGEEREFLWGCVYPNCSVFAVLKMREGRPVGFRS